ncbi:hypothetical protein VNO77_27429 [Canavalia gladiata]|uniref:Uncharacterized protein n=1 Tax=Canavalia gladiata TaxID=3824 RepID=A0AAN9Q6G4_CANGL
MWGDTLGSLKVRMAPSWFSWLVGRSTGLGSLGLGIWKRKFVSLRGSNLGPERSYDFEVCEPESGSMISHSWQTGKLCFLFEPRITPKVLLDSSSSKPLLPPLILFTYSVTYGIRMGLRSASPQSPHSVRLIVTMQRCILLFLIANNSVDLPSSTYNPPLPLTQITPAYRLLNYMCKDKDWVFFLSLDIKA